jgi:subtilisin family serine protease
MGSKLRGLDPRLQNLVDKITPPFTHGGAASALVLAHGKLDEKLLSENGALHIARVTEHIWSVRVDPTRLPDLIGLGRIAYVEAAKVLFPTLTRSVPCIKARPEDLGEDVDGRDVVIGIVDYGIDWTLPDFCDSQTGATRIKFLWDQSLDPTGSERSPSGFEHGVEYTDEDINQALSTFRQGDRERALSVVRHRPWPPRGGEATDTDGHGTHVTLKLNSASGDRRIW